jgi:acetyltransferase-like isoleucine patch superfamily enzyme
VKALREIGCRRALRFALLSAALGLYRMLGLPPLRVWWLRRLGARIGKNVILHDVRFFNFDRRGFSGLSIGDDCFLGSECLIDLAEDVVLAEAVTLAARVLVVTHMNVGYRDHPLQRRFPRRQAPVRLERGCFVGAAVTLLPGVTVGAEAFIAAGSVVTQDVPAGGVVAGVPARPMRRPDASPASGDEQH